MGKRKTLDADGVWRPKKLKYEFTDEKLTASAGLGPLIDWFMQSSQSEALRKIVPNLQSNASYDPMQFVMTLMSGFWYGYDCLEDLEKFEKHSNVLIQLESLPKPRAIGDYLRIFDEKHHQALNEFLTRQALTARKELAPNQPLVLDQDSTSHEQSGDKIEGVAWNYKGEWCLDSLDSCDELGFYYGFKLRPGNTFSSQQAEEEIERIFSHLKFGDKKHYRADSAFCNEQVVRACLKHGAKFTITAHDNMKWEAKAQGITNWQPWKYTEEEVKKAHKKDYKLPEIEVGSMLYQPSWSENLRFYVVVKRTKIQTGEQSSLFQQDGWKYWGVLSNWDLFNHTRQEVIEFHSKRGNAENFLKEQKIAFDLKHFPCLKLDANRAYGYIALIAYNFLRTIARIDEPDKPHYAKKLRHQFICIPGKLLERSRQLIMRIPHAYKKEVQQMTTGWAGILEAALAMG
jgi:hypothetical protein